MTTGGRYFALAALTALMLWPVESHGSEAFVTKVRGSTLTVDKGADAGLEVGMRIEVVRPPEEAVIHPLTGENLGAPEITLGVAEVTRISTRSASARLTETPFMAVRPGDQARFITLEEKMMVEQDQATEAGEKAASERQAIRGETSSLARNIRSIQATIRGLESAITDLRRFDKDVVQPQFRAINRDVDEIKEELSQLRTTVSLLGSAPVKDIGEGEAGGMTEEEIEQWRESMEEEIRKLQEQLKDAVIPTAPAEPGVTVELPQDELAEDLESAPFYTSGWFFGLLAFVGLGGVGFWLWTQMSSGGDEDDEEEEDDEEMALDDDDDDEDVEVDMEDEEDDIVVEETS